MKTHNQARSKGLTKAKSVAVILVMLNFAFKLLEEKTGIYGTKHLFFGISETWQCPCLLSFMVQVLTLILLDLPGLLFFSTYTLLVLFWAEIYHQASKELWNFLLIMSTIVKDLFTFSNKKMQSVILARLTIVTFSFFLADRLEVCQQTSSKFITSLSTLGYTSYRFVLNQTSSYCFGFPF